MVIQLNRLVAANVIVSSSAFDFFGRHEVHVDRNAERREQNAFERIVLREAYFFSGIHGRNKVVEHVSLSDPKKKEKITYE
jgi:hypothetical protein